MFECSSKCHVHKKEYKSFNTKPFVCLFYHLLHCIALMNFIFIWEKNSFCAFCSTISVNLNSDNRWQHSPNLPRQEKTFVLISFISLKKVLRHRPGEVPFQNEDQHENVVNPGPRLSPYPIYSC